MNGNNLLIDTNIALYLFDGDEEIENILQDKNVYFSFVNELELLSYNTLSKDAVNIIKNFIKDCILIDINEEIKNSTINIRKKYNLKLPDAIIAGTSQFLNIPLLTADKDFERIEELPVIIYEI